MRTLRNSKGFTLIELMIVVVIIGILAAIAIPKFTEVSKGAKQAEAEPVLKQICSLVDAQIMKDGTAPANLAAVDGWDDPDAKYFTGWSYTGGSATATLTAAGTGLKVPTMDCATHAITLGT